jgi:hypothetical protein
MDGNDPSASNPVYCRIGDTVRTITAALSWTANAGTSWMNLGAAEFATKENDLFVYLTFNTTDNDVRVGFSRRTDYTIVGDFRARGTTDEGYMAMNYTNYVDANPVELIGRFAATLSAGAGYTWSVPTFTPINLIQRPIYETRETVYASQEVGWQAGATIVSSYRILMHRVFFSINVSGTSDAAGTTMSLPFSNKLEYSRANGYAADSGTYVATGSRGHMNAGATVITLNKDMVNVDFTASGTKTVFHQGDYQIN